MRTKTESAESDSWNLRSVHFIFGLLKLLNLSLLFSEAVFLCSLYMSMSILVLGA